MLEAISTFFGYIMNFIYGIVQNYGLAIIMFTLLVKILLLPLSIKQQRSLEKSQKIQPLIQELQRKYGKDQQKFAEEYQKLLKEKNMTAMSSMGCSGCLLNLIQLPILLGMFYMMISPLTYITKMDAEEINQYKDEVNLNRMNVAIEELQANADSYTEPELEALLEQARNATYVNERYYEIDIIKEKDLMDMSFLGINLSDIASSNKENKMLLIIPVLSTLFTYLSLYITTAINKKKGIRTPKPEDSEVPMPDMRVMNIMMPLMMGFVAYSVPQGVGLYWATSNILGVLQIIALRVIFDKKDDMASEEKLANVKYEVVKEEQDSKIEELSEVNQDSEEVLKEGVADGTPINEINKNRNKQNNNNNKNGNNNNNNKSKNNNNKQNHSSKKKGKNKKKR